MIYMFMFVTSDLEIFIQQRYKIKGQLEAESVRVDIIPDIIEVTGENVNTDILEMYFQGVRSGGGREKEVEWIKIVDDGVAHVKFVSTEGMYNNSLKQLM